jgi:hypothetical protein
VVSRSVYVCKGKGDIRKVVRKDGRESIGCIGDRDKGEMGGVPHKFRRSFFCFTLKKVMFVLSVSKHNT